MGCGGGGVIQKAVMCAEGAANATHPILIVFIVWCVVHGKPSEVDNGRGALGVQGVHAKGELDCGVIAKGNVERVVFARAGAQHAQHSGCVGPIVVDSFQGKAARTTADKGGLVFMLFVVCRGGGYIGEGGKKRGPQQSASPKTNISKGNSRPFRAVISQREGGWLLRTRNLQVQKRHGSLVFVMCLICVTVFS